MAELNARREAEAKERAAAEAERREAEATVVASPPSTIEAAPVETPPTPTLTTIDFRVEATLEQLKALRAFLMANNIKFSKI